MIRAWVRCGQPRSRSSSSELSRSTSTGSVYGRIAHGKWIKTVRTAHLWPWPSSLRILSRIYELPRVG